MMGRAWQVAIGCLVVVLVVVGAFLIKEIVERREERDVWHTAETVRETVFTENRLEHVESRLDVLEREKLDQLERRVAALEGGEK